MKFDVNNIPPLKIVCLVMLTGMLISLSACLPTDNIGLQVFPTSISSRTVSYATTSAQEKWRLSNLLIPQRNTSKVYADNDVVYFIAYSGDGLTHWLEVYDAQTGKLRWKSDNLHFPENSLASDTQRLYVAITGQILVYKIENGELLWKTQEQLPDHTSYWVYPLADTLLVYSEEDTNKSNELIIRSYDLETGFLKGVERMNIPQDNSHLLRTTLFDYWTNGETFWAVTRETEKTRWSVDVDNPLRYQPILVDSTVVFCSGIFSEVLAVDNDTGNLNWKYNGRVVSNLATNSGVVYFIDEDAALVGVNSITGQEMYHIEVSPHATENETRTMSYLVAADDDLVYVYYGDSYELLAFSK